MLTYACERVPITEDNLPCDCVLEELNWDPEQIEEFWDAVSNTLALASGVPVGRCVTTYRPCRLHYPPCGCCACQMTGIPLFDWDAKVVEVRIDGDVVDPDEWVVMRSPGGCDTLERVKGRWPNWQNPKEPEGPGTFAVDVEAGTSVNDPVLWNAAAEVACDMLSYRVGRDNVPDGTVAMQIYGVFLDLRQFTPGSAAVSKMAGLAWVQRLRGLNRSSFSAILSPDQYNGWGLFERLEAQPATP